MRASDTLRGLRSVAVVWAFGMPRGGDRVLRSRHEGDYFGRDANAADDVQLGEWQSRSWVRSSTPKPLVIGWQAFTVTIE